MAEAVKMKKVVFLSSPDECSLLKRDVGENTLYLALNPATYTRLKQQGVAVSSTAEYFTTDSHKRLLAKSKELLGWLRKNAPFAGMGLGVQDAYRELYIFWMRLAIHHCLWLSEVVHNAIEMHRPEIVSAALSNGRKVVDLSIDPAERYAGQIVAALARQSGIIFEDLGILESGSGMKPLPLSLKARAVSLSGYFLRYIRFGWRQALVIIKASLLRKRPVFFTTRRYQMDKLALELKRQFPDKQSEYLEGAVLSSIDIPDPVISLLAGRYAGAILLQKRSLTDLAGIIARKTELFSFHGASFSGVLASKMADNIAGHIVSLYVWSVKADRYLDRVRPSTIISNGNRSDDVLLAELSSRKKIRTIVISHGSHVRPKDEFEAMEWGEHERIFLTAPFSYIALQSPLMDGYLEMFKAKGEAVPTGPLVWGRPIENGANKTMRSKLLSAAGDNVKVIVHAGTPKMTRNLRLYVYETPDEYIKALVDLARAVESIPGAALIVRFRPSVEISVEDIRSRISFSDKVVLSVTEQFADILGMTDLLVSFSSTTIEEALQNRVPVLLYGGEGRYQHVPAFEVRPGEDIKPSAAYHVKKSQDLVDALPKILAVKPKPELFDKFIYPEEARSTIAELLNI